MTIGSHSEYTTKIPQEPLPDAPDTEIEFNIVGLIGENLRRIRTRRGLSLDRLAKASAVSRAMLGQIELGRSSPTIIVLWKIATALELSFSALLKQMPGMGTVVLKKNDTKLLLSQDGRLSSRTLFPYDRSRKIEFYELRLSAHSAAESEAHAPGTTENIVVTRGQIEVVAHGRTDHLEQGDSIVFEADTHHTYRNPGPEEGLYYLVMHYPENVV